MSDAAAPAAGAISATIVAGDTFPWPPTGESTLSALSRTWTWSVFRPTTFFRALPADSAAGAAPIYLVVVGVAAGGIDLFWSGVLAVGPGTDSLPLPFSAAGAAGPSGLVAFLLTPLALLLGLAVATAWIQLALWIFGAGRGGGRTMRVLCYARGPALFAIVPVVGWLVGWIWTVVLIVIGLREAHEAPTWRVVAALFIPPAVLLMLALFGALVVLLAGFPRLI